MRNRIIILALLVVVAGLLIAARPIQETFFDQDCDGTTCTIEAKLKNEYSSCVYWQPGENTPYEIYLGFYGEQAGDPDLLGFCLAHYGDRIE